MTSPIGWSVFINLVAIAGGTRSTATSDSAATKACPELRPFRRDPALKDPAVKLRTGCGNPRRIAAKLLVNDVHDDLFVRDDAKNSGESAVARDEDPQVAVEPPNVVFRQNALGRVAISPVLESVCAVDVGGHCGISKCASFALEALRRAQWASQPIGDDTQCATRFHRSETRSAHWCSVMCTSALVIRIAANHLLLPLCASLSKVLRQTIQISGQISAPS